MILGLREWHLLTIIGIHCIGCIHSGNAQTLTVNRSTLAFTGRVGSDNPPGQSISVTGPGSVQFAVSSNVPWLRVIQSATTPPATVTAFVDIVGLAAGNYGGTITLLSTAPSTAILILVTLRLD